MESFSCHRSDLSHSDAVRPHHQHETSISAFYPLSSDALQAIDAIEYITDHLKKDEEVKICRNDWKYVAMVIDRLLLIIFFGITLGGTVGESSYELRKEVFLSLGILLSAPYVFQSVDQKAELKRLIGLYKSGGQL